MPDSRAVALIGDYSPKVVAHRAIPLALALARDAVPAGVSWEWIQTRDLGEPSLQLQRFSGLWVVPASPYENTAGVLSAIRWARESKIPLLGTCGGFQHMLIEFARHVVGLSNADHAETHPDGSVLVVSRLACPLVEKTGAIHFTPGSRLHAIYHRASAEEGYRCNYGLNAAYRAAVERAGLQFTAHDEAGEARGAELPESIHPFFIGTLFQPERAALRDELPPLARAFARAACAAW
jgi:CTP synthase (UTP-ammonia lyase)